MAKTRSTPPARPHPDAAGTQLQQGLALHRQGRYAEAKIAYEAILAAHPRHFDALNLLGTLALQTGNFAAAVSLIGRAIAIDSKVAAAHNNLGNALLFLGRFDDALASYDKVVALTPDQAEAHYNRANALRELKRLDDALAGYEKALALKPDYVEAQNNRGSALLNLGRPDDALAAIDRAIALTPGNADAYNNRGNALMALQRPDDALASYDKAVAFNPDQAATHFNRGSALAALGRLDEAVASFDRAIALRKDYAGAYNNRGNALLALKRYDEALADYARALSARADYAEAYANRGFALIEMKRLDEAVASLDQALALNPTQAEVHYNRGFALENLKRLDEALVSYQTALTLKPDYEFLRGTIVHTRMKLCDWANLTDELSGLRAAILAGQKAILPFAALSLLDEPDVHLRAATTYAAAKYPRKATLGPIAQRARSGKIRIGYYSADLREHAMAYLLAELFEAHDRARFEIVGFSLGPDLQDAMRKRIAAAFDRFFDVRDRNDAAVAKLSREQGIDIAVDLNAYTQDSRPGMFAEGCAPIQVNYLSYPGTMGADYIDYIVADRTVIPEIRRRDFTEKVVYLPHSYQANDSKRRISERVFARAELGLPETGFVFCCFNNNHKILPQMFDIWMRLLKAVNGSVLWLLEDNPTAAANLRREAAARGVDGARLVFAGRMPLDEHLARHRAADLFLDTLPYNAHTTASDALWCGLPLLTCTGTAFAARVAASLLTTLGLPELITGTLVDYEAQALHLARDAAKLGAIRRKLAANRLTSPLFDGRLIAGHLEAAYTTMYERHHAGLPPEGFAVG